MAREVVIRTQEEIDAVLNRCVEADAKGGSAYPGMTYEQGVKYAIDWLLNKDADPVFEEE